MVSPVSGTVKRPTRQVKVGSAPAKQSSTVDGRSPVTSRQVRGFGVRRQPHPQPPLPTSRAHYAVQRSHFPVDTDGHNTHRAVRAPVVSQRTPSPARHGLAGSASLRCLPSERKSLLRMRRKLTAIAAALTAFASMAAWGGATPAAAAGPALLPLTITNDTGRADAVHLYVLGVDLSTGKLGYANAAGGFTAWGPGGTPPVPAPDVSIAGPGNGRTTTIPVPRGMSGRVYFSLGDRLEFFLAPGGLVQPAPWAGGDANRDVLFDWSEFTYNDAGLWLNSSQVDMFAVPHTVSVTTGSGAVRSTGTLVAGGRDNVISGIRSQPGWGGSVQTRSDGTVLRVLAPGKTADAGQLDSGYLDPYISSAWNAYTGKTLTVVPFADRPDTRYFGRTSGTVMNFTDGSGRQVASFRKPTSANVWGCDGALGAPNDQVVGPIARTLCAALNRGTLGGIDTQPGGNNADFYLSNPTNQYAKLVH